MVTRARSLVTGLLALATLTVLVAGLPVALFEFGGSPLPRRIPSWHHVSAFLASPATGALALGAIRELSWLAWLSFALAVLAEAQAAVRGRNAPRLRLGGMQGGAARLVALAALMFAAPSTFTLTASAAVVPAHAHHVSSRPDEVRVITVRRGECLWLIAQHYLGAGDRYPEIVKLNFGHAMGDGQIFADPALIQPGWRLSIPGTPGHAAEPAASSVRHHLGHPTRDDLYRRWHHAASRHAPVDDTFTGDVADRGWPEAGGSGSRQLIATPARHEVPAAVVFIAGALAGGVLTSLARLRHRQRQFRRTGRRIALPVEPQIRAAEHRLRAAAAEQPMPTLPEALRCLERGIVGTGQGLPDIVGLHVTPDLLEVLLASPAPDAPPPPYEIAPGRQGMCWHLRLPPPGGAAWPGPAGHSSGLLPALFAAGSTAAGHLLVDLEALHVVGCDGPAELIDQVLTAAGTELATGQWGDSWYELILVGFGELEVLGRAEHCASIDEALWLLDERCLRVRGRLDGLPAADLRQLRLTAPDDEDWGVTIMVSRLEPTPDQLTRLLNLAEDGPGGIAALIAGDLEAADGRMAPAVMQLAPDPERPGEILANVVPLQITVRPRTLPAADYDAISTLLTVAADIEDSGPDEQPYEVYGAPPWIQDVAEQADLEVVRQDEEPDATDADPQWTPQGAAMVDEAEFGGPVWHDADEFAEPRWTGQGASEGWLEAQGDSVYDGGEPKPWEEVPRLEVRILGPLAITGGQEQLQPKQAELVVALALAAPGGLSNSALCTLLGNDPDHPKPPDAVRQIITRARRRLGRARDGQERIVHVGNGHYLLHPEATLDWTEFRSLIAGGRPDDLRAALAQVRGEPFTGSYYWWIDIPLLETVRAEVTDAAAKLAEFELAAGSPPAAARAALTGLSAEPSAEQLWRLLMRAEHAAGNVSGVTEAWRHCLDAIEEIAPGGEPHPETAALYRRLTSRQQVATPG